MTTSPIHPGFMALHSHRAENLLETVVAWLQAHPLGPLEEEVFIVQSNAVAEWLKMALAHGLGVCAATRVELPARFFWRTSRQVLGRAAVPVESPLDKVPLTWRLMQTLPGLLADPTQAAVYAPVAGFVHTEGGGAPPLRMLQLCQRLADLYDQYQVYRPDWLQDWAAGHPQLLAGDGRRLPVPVGQVWQAALWQHLMAGLEPTQRSATRPNLHQRVIARLAEAAPRSHTDDFGDASAHSHIGSSFHAQAEAEAEAEVDVDAYRAADGAAPLHGLPRRVVAFGMSHLPQGLLDMLGALSSHTQVLLAVPNPCQYHWADVIDGRELLRMQHRRHALKGGVDLSALPLADMHAHAHPLLAAWGRQSRDFVRLLDAFDVSAQARFQPDWPRLDLFDDPARPDGLSHADPPQPTLLQQIQLNIRDLVPMAAQTALQGQPGHSWLPGDQSIVFHVAHSAVRELEVLHDQLLALLADGGAAASATVGHAAGQAAGQAGVAGRAPLRPRDVVVMVPDIAAVAPAVQAVFGQYPRGDARHIPFDIADMGAESLSPLMAAWQWLWTLPHQRAAYSEWLALLEVPAVQARFGLTADDLPRMSGWMAGAGLRWGLHQGHRSHLGLAECGEQNSARFALRRMLTGFMVGDAPHALHDSQTVGADVNDLAAQADDTEPYAEVGGLDASLAGALAHVLDALDAWWAVATVPATPAEWVARGRALAAALFQPSPTGQAATAAAREADEQALAALNQAGQRWLQACEQAGFAEVVDLDVARTAWDHALVSPSVDTRFQAGGVTFCTLMPMRAIPFRVVCLLGMNDADYPRRASQSDFDLMTQPGMTRPGDRARRDDDRQLMLEALMSARDVFYLSWAGRSVRDNTEQPPSVLVSQLRDHIAAGWGPQVLPALTTEHPLQPFSRRYFEATGCPTGAKLFTHAHEWRDMHTSEKEQTIQSEKALKPDLVHEMAVPAFTPDPAVSLTLRVLTDALRHPVKAFFKRRLGVDFGREDDITPDEEPFGVDGLTTYGMLRDALAAVPPDATLAHAVDAAHAALGRLQRSGALPMGAMGDLATASLTAPLTQMLVAWFDVQRVHTQPAERLRVTHCSGDVMLQDWVDGLWCADAPDQGSSPRSPFMPQQPQAEPQTPIPDHAQTEALLEGQPCCNGPRVWLGREVSRLVGKPATRDKPAELRADKLLGVWLRCLVLSAFDAEPAMRPNHHAVVVARDATIWVTPLPPAEACDTLDRLLGVWLQSMQAPLPLPPKTALKWLADRGDGHVTRECYEGGYQQTGEGEDPFWQRMYPDFEALTACGRFETLADTVYAPLQHWVNTCIQVVPHPQPDAPDRVTPAEGALA